MVNKYGFNLILWLVVLLYSACSKTEDTASRTVIVYMAADNDLYDNALWNIEQMKSSFPRNEDNNLIVFVNLPDEQPYLIKIEADGEKIIKEYEEINTVEVANMRQILTEIINLYPAERYGLILWSHSSSWLPVGFRARSFGEENGMQMDIMDLKNALPVKFDYLLFDACLMGSVEVAYELRRNTDYIIAPSTETLYTGFPYDLIIPELMEFTPDFTGIAKKYMDYYQQLSGIYQSATISVIHTKELESLAQTTRQIISEHPPRKDSFNRSLVQRLDTYQDQYIFDFADFIFKAFPAAPKDRWDDQLKKVVLYSAHTKEFMKVFTIETYCGLSSYIPLESAHEVNAYYQQLQWCKDSGFEELF